MSINEFFDAIMHGNASVITADNIGMINAEALKLYEIPQLNAEEIDELKKIVMICNVLYNRTDMTIQPVEDGFYDLLLEKYKTYDSHFQVGSAIVDFQNFIENDLDNPTKIAECPIIFAKDIERDEVHQAVHDQIMRKGEPILTAQDFYEVPITFNAPYISKRSHNTEHNHPSLVGTLDKAKFVLNQDAINAGAFNDDNVKVLERDFFQYHIAKGIIRPDQEISVVMELKYDGISVEADCGYTLQSARSRGDTGIGVASDMTPILKDYQFKHAACMIGEDPIGVKFEAIITKTDLAKFNVARGRNYANCRSAIVGLFGASDAYRYRDYITLVPLALDREQFKYPIRNRVEEIEFLNKVFVSHGEPLRYMVYTGTISDVLYMIKAFLDEAKIARDYLNFLYDGIVISYLDEDIRAKLGRENYINKFSMAVKFDPEEKQTIFRGYTYEVGQNGQITPMIHYDPVEFRGTIHTKSTGSSFNRFQELALKYGDYINVKYVNDVMPYVSRLECDHNRHNPNPLIEFIDTCPICGSKLVISDSGKTVLCPNMECAGRSIQRMVNMFAKLNIKGFADSTFTILKEFDHLYKFYGPDGSINRDFYVEKLGVADGNAFSDALTSLVTQPWKDYMIMGALGFSSIAYKKWQSILDKIKIGAINTMFMGSPDPQHFKALLLQAVPGIGDVTATTIVNEWNFFYQDIEFILKWIPLEESFGHAAESLGEIRFTGFRNLQLAEQLNTLGFDASDSSVTKKTSILLIPYEGFNSSKVEKAKKNASTQIIPVQEFIDNSEKYISKKLQIDMG